MTVTEAEAAAHFCAKKEFRVNIPSENRPVMPDKANRPFLVADIGGGYFRLTNNLTKIPLKFY